MSFTDMTDLRQVLNPNVLHIVIRNKIQYAGDHICKFPSFLFHPVFR